MNILLPCLKLRAKAFWDLANSKKVFNPIDTAYDYGLLQNNIAACAAIGFSKQFLLRLWIVSRVSPTKKFTGRINIVHNPESEEERYHMCAKTLEDVRSKKVWNVSKDFLQIIASIFLLSKTDKDRIIYHYSPFNVKSSTS